MSKIIILVLSFLIAGTVFAEKNLRVEARNQVKQVKQIVASTTDKIKGLRDERKAQAEVKLREIKNKYQEQRQARIAAYIEKMINRFNATAERLDGLAKRIEIHLTKLEAKKVVVTEARVLLTTAETKIQTAKDTIAKIKPASDTALSANDIKVSLFKPGLMELTTSTKAAWASLSA